MMGSPKYEELILDAIDQLRKRKARPDLDRISHMLERRHGLKYPEVNEQLTKLVHSGIVIKVDYKGNTSYRNAAKWVRTKNQFFGSFFNNSGISCAILEAVGSLSVPSLEESPTKSASLLDIEKFLLKRDSQSNLNIATLKSVLEKEVMGGSIRLLPSKDYCITQNGQETLKNRTTTVKKHKISVESTTNEKPTKELTQDSVCDYCLFGAMSNRKGVPEVLMVCKDCKIKAHPTCMDYDEDADVLFGQTQSPWQCLDCRVCVVCGDPSEGEAMLCCSLCFKTYHMTCHAPLIKTRPSAKWICSYCSFKSDEKEKSFEKEGNSFAETSDSEATSESLDELLVDANFRESIKDYPQVVPLANRWSVSEVEAFFRHIGFCNEATAFRKQEIDGVSLLLMKRNDVLVELSVKLGPALKIYNHVTRLQERYELYLKDRV